MLHACSYTICLVFCYTSWHFYAFSGTNLLTRCHSASSLFSAVFVFQKSYTGNILGIGWNKNRTSQYLPSFQKTEEEMERGHGPASPPGVTAQPLAVPPYGEGTLVHFWRCPFTYKDPRREKPKDPINFPKTHRDSPPSSTRDREGQEPLPGTLPEREITTGGLLHAMLASGVMSE
jgi:hypothetical protein